jgi:DNA sulfur modification protein DndD
MVFTTLKDEWERDSEGLDVYNFLDDTDIDMLKRLVDTRYANTFGPLDRERVALNQSVEDLPALNKRIDELRTQLIGDDYTIIKEYEKNEGNLNQLRDALKEKKGELEKIDKKIDQYDVQVTPTDDPRYDILKKLPELFDQLSERLLAARKSSIEQRMKEYLNKNLIAYKDVISKVELAIDKGEISFKMFHIRGNEINLDQLNAASKQALMQVLLKVLYELGDYDPPVMIDTVMGVMSLDYRDALLENYFPNLASQTILLSTDVEITAEHGFPMLKDSIARVYTLHRDKVEQCTNVTEDYFGLTL